MQLKTGKVRWGRARPSVYPAPPRAGVHPLPGQGLKGRAELPRVPEVMVSSLTCIISPHVLASCQTRRGDKEYLCGFIRDLTSLIYWQNLPLSTYCQLILLPLSCAPASRGTKRTHPCPPGLYNLISRTGEDKIGWVPGSSQWLSVERSSLEMELAFRKGRGPSGGCGGWATHVTFK